MTRMVTEANFPPMIALAGGDCMARMHIVGKRGLNGWKISKANDWASISSGQRPRLSHNCWHAEWDGSCPRHLDSAIRSRCGILEDRSRGRDRRGGAHLRRLQAEGYPILADTLDWKDPMAGNSVLVDQDWLKVPGHRDVALRFLKASAEGFALFHRNPELARQTMAKWNGNMGNELG